MLWHKLYFYCFDAVPTLTVPHVNQYFHSTKPLLYIPENVQQVHQNTETIVQSPRLFFLQKNSSAYQETKTLLMQKVVRMHRYDHRFRWRALIAKQGTDGLVSFPKRGCIFHHKLNRTGHPGLGIMHITCNNAWGNAGSNTR